MADNHKFAFNNFATDIFAGIPVADFKTSHDWYERLFGCPPSFYPNDVEAVWQVAEHQWIYIIVDKGRAGNSIQNVKGDELDKLVSEISKRGIDFDKDDHPADNTRKVIYFDPDGNEIGFIKVAE
jgi:hypothetical protein